MREVRLKQKGMNYSRSHSYGNGNPPGGAADHGHIPAKVEIRRHFLRVQCWREILIMQL